jgi:hypothetical protein
MPSDTELRGDICAGIVGGSYMTMTGAEYLKRAKRLIEEEQMKPNPYNALIAFLCEAVRLWRETDKGVKP